MRYKIPRFIALLVYVIGIMDIVSALIPATLSRWQIIRDILPIEIIHTTRTLTLLGGIFLVYLGSALWKQKKRAWTLAVITLVFTLFFHLSKGLDIEETIASAVTIMFLWYFRSLYYVESHRTKYVSAIIRSIFILLILIIYRSIGQNYLHLSGSFAHWFENSLSLLSTVAIIVSLAALFAPAFEKHLPSEEDRSHLIELLKIGSEGASYFGLMDDKSLWFDQTQHAAVSYKRVGKYIIVLGEPIGRANKIQSAQQFQKNIQQLGGETVWYNMRDPNLAALLGLTAVKIGEDAVIPLEQFSLSGPELKNVRNAVAHIAKLSLIYSWYNMGEIPWVELRLVDGLYKSWIEDKKTSALTFSLGFYPFPAISEGHILLVKNNSGSLLAVLSFYPYHQKSYVLDLMIHAKSSPCGIVESAIIEAVYHFKSLNIHELNLGMAPLSNIEFMGSNKLTSNIRNLLMSQFNKFYGYKSLASFKAKFNPVWQSKYIFLKSSSQLPSTLLVLAQAHRK